MAYKLENVVPWGRSYEEYCSFFSITEADLDKKILSVADGPCNFNAEITRRGKSCISIDPIYQFSREEIEVRIQETANTIIKEVRENQDLFLWHYYKSPDGLVSTRLSSMKIFLEDFHAGLKQGRYIIGEMPPLNFQDKSFDIVLCSHFLFTYSHKLDLNFHIESIKEMMRVGHEARIFPVLAHDSSKSIHIDNVLSHFNSNGYIARFQKVDYEFQVGGDQMLIVKNK
ncbi:MAG: hypothetical protein JXB49_23855 [Bacteroidales bacterium]|nr:hypothetical protein [Bacteroidales bacterium]